MLIVPKADYRTPLEKALGVDPATAIERGMTPAQRARQRAVEALRRQGIKVLELPGGKWSVTPEYPAGATDAQRRQIDASCEAWMRRIADARR